MPRPQGLGLTRLGAEELAAAHPRLASAPPPPRADGQTVVLPRSGRRLGYCEYVDAATPPASLRAVVLLPGIPGSRLFTHPEVRRRGFVPGWRLLVLERPGLGLSDPPPEPYSYAAVSSADLTEFCRQLGLRRVAVIGFSAGTPFATALACIRPQPPPPPPLPSGTQQPPPPPSPANAAASEAAASTEPASVRSTAAVGREAPAAPTPAVAPTPAPADAAAEAAIVRDTDAAAADARSDAGAGAEAGGEAGATAKPPGLAAHKAGPQGGAETRLASPVAPRGVDGADDGAPALPPPPPAAAAAAAAAGEQPEEDAEVVVVAGVALVSAIGPPDTPNKRRGMALLFQVAYWAAAYAPWLIGMVVRAEAAAFRRRPLKALRDSFAPYSAKADVEALRRPEVEELFMESALEVYGRGQEDAVHRENLMFAGRAGWGFDPAARHAPVAIWQGGRDRGCTPAMATHLADRMAAAAGAAAEGTAKAGAGRWDAGDGDSDGGGGQRSGGAGDSAGACGRGDGGGGSGPSCGGGGGSGGGGDGGGVRVKVVPEAGHMLYFDVWGEVVEWVNGLGAGGAESPPPPAVGAVGAAAAGGGGGGGSGGAQGESGE
ncbi:hypothetical protein GPECTOR_107g151 [Gonium pectorale]|uniref:AB hydrolase-1 domain-containing protein n=1 Tax=Gonium pectorale TaxID=33097 RepID=A0A150FZK1_GONPE|nr:hypothetical protein GPECTOR_107g151 [Gonium pectorale]|eukprot:KXZ43007.1 hypothetical protein GPECTOR_107g151 [Gonium pectorale]